MTIEEAIKNREECLKYLEGLGPRATPENVEAVRWSLTALREYAKKPPCYLEEKDNPYPLCVGRGFANCTHCCLWAQFDEDQDESRVNPPLTMDQLQRMSGEPVWCEEYECWGIVKCDTVGVWVKKPFLIGVFGTGVNTNFEYDIKARGLTLYRRRPEVAG